MSRFRPDQPNASDTAGVPIRKVEPAASTVIVKRELEAAGYTLTTHRLGQFIVNGPSFRKKLHNHRALVEFVDKLRVAAGREPIIG